MAHKVLCLVLFLAVCSSYVKATSTSCDLNESKLARIVSNSGEHIKYTYTYTIVKL